MHLQQTHNSKPKLEVPQREVRNFKGVVQGQMHNSRGDKTRKESHQWAQVRNLEEDKT
jgi:hypothetical protein